ncbi:MAG: DUF3459 domain-containing protein, partial [Rhodospirillales bacterium]|nr:DUF3459 domain-containing protein [Rhodospirillales bacterium]
VAFYGRNLDGAHLPFNFQLVFTAWSAAAIASLVREYEAALPQGGWPNWVLGNHDQPRIATRLGEAQARIAAMLLLTLRGTPTLYYGDELGITDVPIPPDRVQDPWAKNEPGLGLGRDPSRTPMPWDDTPNAGFSSGEPWLPLNPDHAQRNVARLRQDPTSLLMLYRRLIKLRHATPALSIGDVSAVGAIGDVLCFERRSGDARLLVLLNLGGHPASIPLPSDVSTVRLMISTVRETTDQAWNGAVELAPAEGLVLETVARA